MLKRNKLSAFQTNKGIVEITCSKDLSFQITWFFYIAVLLYLSTQSTLYTVTRLIQAFTLIYTSTFHMRFLFQCFLANIHTDS